MWLETDRKTGFILIFMSLEKLAGLENVFLIFNQRKEKRVLFSTDLRN